MHHQNSWLQLAFDKKKIINALVLFLDLKFSPYPLKSLKNNLLTLKQCFVVKLRVAPYEIFMTEIYKTVYGLQTLQRYKQFIVFMKRKYKIYIFINIKVFQNNLLHIFWKVHLSRLKSDNPFYWSERVHFVIFQWNSASGGWAQFFG